MARSRHESHHSEGITDQKSLQRTFATKSAISGQIPFLGGRSLCDLSLVIYRAGRRHLVMRARRNGPWQGGYAWTTRPLAPCSAAPWLRTENAHFSSFRRTPPARIFRRGSRLPTRKPVG